MFGLFAFHVFFSQLQVFACQRVQQCGLWQFNADNITYDHCLPDMNILRVVHL